jgi:hypothetical protein
MPNPNNFDDKTEFMKVCVPMMVDEGREQDQAVAACSSMWDERGAMHAGKQVTTTTYTIGKDGTVTVATSSGPAVAVKAVGDWELDVVPVPFGSSDNRDSDKQWFDHMTEIMEDVYSTPLVLYQHGVEQGAKDFQARPKAIGKSVPGSLEKRSDGWHVRVILNKAMKVAKDIMDAARKGLVAVSSDSISHIARLEVNGKLINYEKNRPGRIAIWPLAGFSLWELGNGNFQPSNRQAIALPVMKAMYRDAGIPFPEIKQSEFTDGVLPEADEAAKRARKEEIIRKAKQILANYQGRK